MTGFLFVSIILFVVIGLSPVQFQTTSIMAIIPSADKDFSVIFQVCAGDTIMRAPEVKISSDIEEKNVRISQEIQPNSCRQTSAFIKATDSSTIAMEKIDKKNLNIMISNIEKDIAKIQSEISDKNAQILDLVDQYSKSESNQVLNKKVNDLTVEISKLKKDLQGKKIERDRLLVQLKG